MLNEPKTPDTASAEITDELLTQAAGGKEYVTAGFNKRWKVVIDSRGEVAEYPKVGTLVTYADVLAYTSQLSKRGISYHIESDC